MKVALIKTCNVEGIFCSVPRVKSPALISEELPGIRTLAGMSCLVGICRNGVRALCKSMPSVTQQTS